MIYYETACKKLATQVQPIETSNLNRISKNFRTYLIGDQSDEIDASRELYRAVAELSGKDHTDTFEDCRKHAWFSVSFDTRKVRVISNSCRLRWCPLCSSTLSRYRTHSISDWLGEQSTARFLTLTVKHSTEDLDTQIKKLYYYFKQLRKIVYFSQVVTGGIWFFQVKRSRRTGEWHPHLHCLVTGSYIIHPRLSEIWESITHGSTVVDIRTIRDEKSIAVYVSRYSSRPCSLNEFSLKDRLEIYSVIHGKRLCGKWGTGNECSLSPSKTIDVSEWRKVGSWRTVIHHAPFLSYARIVFKCWKQDRAIPVFIDLTCLEKPEHLFDTQDLRNAVLLHYYCEDLE